MGAHKATTPQSKLPGHHTPIFWGFAVSAGVCLQAPHPPGTLPRVPTQPRARHSLKITPRAPPPQLSPPRSALPSHYCIKSLSLMTVELNPNPISRTNDDFYQSFPKCHPRKQAVSPLGWFLLLHSARWPPCPRGHGNPPCFSDIFRRMWVLYSLFFVKISLLASALKLVLMPDKHPRGMLNPLRVGDSFQVASREPR